jgi:transposase-like protein
MSVLSHRHQRFNVDTCDMYSHTLRWHDRPLHGPRCHSHDVDPWGSSHDRPGVKRSWCHGCRRTVNDLTNTRLSPSRRSLAPWRLATLLWCLTCSSRRLARAVGVQVRTSDRWCWGLRHTAISDAIDRQWEGTVEAEERYHSAGNQGHAKQGGPKPVGRRPRCRRNRCEPGRGHDDQDRPAIMAWVNRPGAVVLQAVRDCPVSTVPKAADLAVQAGSRLYTDSASRDRALKGDVHAFVNHTQQEYARGDVHEHRAECLFSWLKPYVRVFRGLSQDHLPGDVGFLQCLRNFRHQNACEQAERILQAA